MDDEVGNRIATALADLIRQRGVDELRDPGAIRAQLTNALGSSAEQHTREIRVVAEAAGEGIPERVGRGEQGLGEWLAEQTGYEVGIATWAVSVWSTAVAGETGSAGGASAGVPVWSTPLPPPPGSDTGGPAAPASPPAPPGAASPPMAGTPPPPPSAKPVPPPPPTPGEVPNLPPPPDRFHPEPMPRDQQPTVVVGEAAEGVPLPPPPPPPGAPPEHHEMSDETNPGPGWRTPVIVAVIVGLVLAVGSVVAVFALSSDSTGSEAETGSSETSTRSSSPEERLLRRMSEFTGCEASTVPPEEGFGSLAADGDLFVSATIEPSAMVTCAGSGPVDQVDAWLFESRTSPAGDAFEEGAFAVDEDPAPVDDPDHPEATEYYAYTSSEDDSATLVELRGSDLVVAYSVVSGTASELERWYGVSSTTTSSTTTSTSTPSTPTTTFDRTQIITDPARVRPAPNSAPYTIGDCAQGEGDLMVRLIPAPCGSATANYKMVAVAFQSRGCPSDAPVELFATVVLDGRTRAGYLCFASV